jgi:uncharacterized protein
LAEVIASTADRIDWTVWVALFGLFAAGLVKGTTGLGYATCALPFLVLAIDAKTAMALVVVPAMMTNISLALFTGHMRETVSRFYPLYLAMAPGIVCGVGLLVWVDPDLTIKALGCVLFAYGCFALLSPSATLSLVAERWLKVPIGFCNGALAGLTGSQVMPLFPYMMALRMDHDRQIQAINLAVLLTSTLQVCGLAVAGVYDATLAATALAAVVPALLGVSLGARLRRSMPVPLVRRLVLLVLVVMGGTMLAR